MLQIYCTGQENTNVLLEKPVVADFSIPGSPVVDSNANAIVLSDLGAVQYTWNASSGLAYVFSRHTRIRILHKSAFDLATIIVGYFPPDYAKGIVKTIVATTYNLEQGSVVSTPLPGTDIICLKVNKEITQVKFTMPAVKEGAIIEYTYAYVSPDLHTLPSWHFQWVGYPCLYSEYDMEIPEGVRYVRTRLGYHPFAIDQGGVGQKMYGQILNTNQHQWVMKDIPAFRRESYLSAASNYIDQLKFYRDEHWGSIVTAALKAYDLSGMFHDENTWMEEWMNHMDIDASSHLAFAKSLYYYISSHFTCIDHDGIYITGNMRNTAKKGSGTVADLNILLVGALRKAGLKADPVMLSTKENGTVSVLYPQLKEFNYVIARLTIGKKVYFLDASRPLLGFGQLPGNCYNGYTQVLNEEDATPFALTTDSLYERKATILFLYAEGKKMKGTFLATLGMQESYNARVAIRKTGKDAFVGNEQPAWQDETISNVSFDSLSMPEMPLTIHYDLTGKDLDDAGPVYINPLAGLALRENPFEAAQREYPVEMDYVMNDLFVVNLDIPEGYVVDELPQSSKAAFNGGEGFFDYLIEKTDNRIQLRCQLKLNRANYAPADYAALREFFAYIVKKESEQVVLKKK